MTRYRRGTRDLRGYYISHSRVVQVLHLHVRSCSLAVYAAVGDCDIRFHRIAVLRVLPSRSCWFRHAIVPVYRLSSGVLRTGLR